MGYADQVHYNFPIPARVRDNEPAGQMPTPTDFPPAEAEVIAENNEQILRGEDAGMSWGGGGETSTATERNAPTIPPGAKAAVGVDPQTVTETDPTPSEFGQPTLPDSPRGASGNWNMAAIANGTRIGG